MTLRLPPLITEGGGADKVLSR